MRFGEALEIAARRFGLAGHPEARLGHAGTLVVLGALLLALGAACVLVAVAGAGIWLYGVGAGLRGLFVAGEKT